MRRPAREELGAQLSLDSYENSSESMHLIGGSLSIPVRISSRPPIESGRAPVPGRMTSRAVRALEHDRRRRADQNGLREALAAVPPIAAQGVDFFESDQWLFPERGSSCSSSRRSQKIAVWRPKRLRLPVATGAPRDCCLPTCQDQTFPAYSTAAAHTQLWGNGGASST